MNASSSWDIARKILCVRLDALGDVLMTTPAMRALKETGNGRRLTLLTSSAGSAIATHIPEVDEVIIYESPWMKATAPRTNSSPDFEMIERVRSLRFDAAVIFTVYSQNPLPAAFFCYLADIPLRLAYSRENPYQLLSDWMPDPEPNEFVRHEVRRQLDLVAHVGCRTNDERMRLSVSNKAIKSVGKLLSEIGIGPGRPWLVIHPGATAPSRRYPPESFAAAARLLVEQLDCRIIFTGTAQEHDLVEGIQSAMGFGSHSFAGRLDLGGMAALIYLAPLLISNNTGPVHIASAVGTPVVVLYALTNPQHTPWAVPHRVLSHDVPCKYCYKSVCPAGHHDCLRQITPEKVAAAAAELLTETAKERFEKESICTRLELMPSITTQPPAW
jgi:lipopolysaccharide heptosyltransferase II